MIRWLACCVLLPCTLLAGDGSMSVQVRGQAQTLAVIRAGASVSGTPVIFLPGDGGWRGLAVTMARTIASWGHDVYGFDTKEYLETSSQNGSRLTVEQMSEDVGAVAASVAARSGRGVIFVGWSQGAGMAVAAATKSRDRRVIQGVISLGLPESAVLGWDWKATLASLARRTPDQPAFEISPLLAQLRSAPLWMIHGSKDEYTTVAAERALFNTVGGAKHLDEIDNANHRFDGCLDKLYSSIKEGIAWIASRQG